MADSNDTPVSRKEGRKIMQKRAARRLFQEEPEDREVSAPKVDPPSENSLGARRKTKPQQKVRVKLPEFHREDKPKPLSRWETRDMANFNKLIELEERDMVAEDGETVTIRVPVSPDEFLGGFPTDDQVGSEGSLSLPKKLIMFVVDFFLALILLPRKATLCFKNGVIVGLKLVTIAGLTTALYCLSSARNVDPCAVQQAPSMTANAVEYMLGGSTSTQICCEADDRDRRALGSPWSYLELPPSVTIANKGLTPKEEEEELLGGLGLPTDLSPTTWTPDFSEEVTTASHDEIESSGFRPKDVTKLLSKEVKKLTTERKKLKTSLRALYVERDRILQDVHALSRQRAQLKQRLDETRLEEYHAKEDIDYLRQQIIEAKATLQNLMEREGLDLELQKKEKTDLEEDPVPNLLWIPLGGFMLLSIVLISHMASQRCLKKREEKPTEEADELEMEMKEGKKQDEEESKLQMLEKEEETGK